MFGKSEAILALNQKYILDDGDDALKKRSDVQKLYIQCKKNSSILNKAAPITVYLCTFRCNR